MGGNVELIGTVAVCIAAILGVLFSIRKLDAPLNRLEVVIQKLADSIDRLDMQMTVVDKRLAEHGRQLDGIDKRLTAVETLVSVLNGGNK